MDEFKKALIAEVGCLCKWCRESNRSNNSRKNNARAKRLRRGIVRSALKRGLRNEVMNAAE
jgi:hypothetical protein